MLAVLRDRTYRHLFGAQILALTGTGLATVALGLLAYDLAGADTGAELGTALAIKMVAYVTVAPVAAAIVRGLPRRAVLVSLDVVRAAVAVLLPWVDQVWQVYVLIFLLQAASATFTPAFQATIPDVLPEEHDYTRALTLSRLAYDLESLLSPMLAAAALLVVTFDYLFVGTAVGFLASALLVVSVALAKPEPVPRRKGGIHDATTRGIRVYLATPRLRGLLAVHLAVSAAGSMVLVNTVAYVRDVLDRPASDVAIALGANGVGSLLAALTLPRLLDRVTDRTVMLRASVLLASLMFAGIALTTAPASWHWPALLLLWALIGAGSSLVLTPSARLLRRSADSTHRPVLFAADFALSHACWLLCYPLAGWAATATTMGTTFAMLAVITTGTAVAATRLWPTHDPDTLEHEHHDLDPDHHHLHDAVPAGGVSRPVFSGQCSH